MRRTIYRVLVCTLVIVPFLLACKNEASSEFPANFQLVGQVKPRDARSISSNQWSIGAETIDRNYSSYAAWREYLGPLGVKSARLQSGWARTDAGRGTLDFTWLDPVIDDMIAQGVQPWLSLGYGNPAYSGGGTAERDSPLPVGAARIAWLAYVREVAARYRGKVSAYEIWNEPDAHANIRAADYGQFAFETARAIRQADPSASIILGALSQAVKSNNSPRETKGALFSREFLKRFVALGGSGLAQEITYHSYSDNPDKIYKSLEEFVRTIDAEDRGLRVRQGEGGAPSVNQPQFALSREYWTEESQAKWILRRMLADAYRGIPSSIFTISDLHYPKGDTGLGWKNSKGILETYAYAPNQAGDNRRVARPKMAYPAIQAVTAIFDAGVKPVALGCRVEGASQATSVYSFQRNNGATAIAIWRSSDRPGEHPFHEKVAVRCQRAVFSSDPVYVDLLTRTVYRAYGIAAANSANLEIRNLPIYDSPVLLADQRLVSIQ